MTIKRVTIALTQEYIQSVGGLDSLTSSTLPEMVKDVEGFQVVEIIGRNRFMNGLVAAEKFPELKKLFMGKGIVSLDADASLGVSKSMLHRFSRARHP